MTFHSERGYAMAALLVGLSVMAIMFTVLMPVWKQTAQREKEAELIFRGNQYARALMLYERTHGPGTTPPNIDALIEAHVLRKKYKDPITGQDFEVLRATQQQPGQQPGQGGQVPQGQRGGPATSSPFGGAPGSTPGRGATPGFGSPGQGTGGIGGVSGVVSKSTATSIKIYNGHTHYNEWLFTKAAAPQAPGAAAPGTMPGVGGGQRGRGGPQGPGGFPGIGGPGGARPGGPGFPGGPGGAGQPPGGTSIQVTPDGRRIMTLPSGQQITLPPGGPGPGTTFQPIQVPTGRGRGGV